MLDQAKEIFFNHWRDGVEVLVLAVLFYLVYLSFRNSRIAKTVVFLVSVLIALTLLSRLLGLDVIVWVVRVLSGFVALATVVIFQPELRRALAEIGSYRFFGLAQQKVEFVERLDEAVRKLSVKRFGALFAIERRIDLKPFLETGVAIGGEFSNELILTIFHPKTALHDGGMILRQDTVVAAGCVFPVSQREMMDRSIGLRHRAGIGLTEETDAIAVIVSEETGHVSICQNGEIERNLDSESFRARLAELLTLETRKEDEEETAGSSPNSTKSSSQNDLRTDEPALKKLES